MLIVFDTETTGLCPGIDEIIQFSAIDENGSVLMNEYFKPLRKTEFPEATRIHGITYDALRDRQPFECYRDQIQELFDKADALITYNGIFDIRMLRAQGIYINKDKRNNDVMLMFAPIYGERDRKHKAYKWKPLSVCADYYGYEFKAHDSLEDVKATLYCYNQITNKKAGH